MPYTVIVKKCGRITNYRSNVKVIRIKIRDYLNEMEQYEQRITP